MKQKPLALIVFLPTQDYAYTKDFGYKICNLSLKNPHLFFGLYDKLWLDRFKNKNNQKCNLFDASTHRYFKQEVLRRAFISTPNNAEYSLAFQVAKFINSRTKVLFNRNNIHNNFVKDDYGNNTLFINYSYITSKENNLPKKIKGRIVYLGSRNYRKRTIHHREGSHVNTPWQNGDRSEKYGEALLSIYPVIVQNLLDDSFIKIYSNNLDFLWYLILFCSSYFIWFYNRIVAFFYGAMQFVLVLICAWIFFSSQQIFIDVSSFFFFLIWVLL